MLDRAAVRAESAAMMSRWQATVVAINGPLHEAALRVFLLVVLAHWAEHLVQAAQIYVLGWPVPEARGVLGHFYPWVVASEVLHYGYAAVMLAGLWVLRHGFSEPEARRYWNAALAIQFFHHFEHLLLQVQAVLGWNLFGSPVPTSLVQVLVPRVELHLIYNTLVFVPMMAAMGYHVFPRSSAAASRCTCAWHRGVASAA